MYKGASDGAQRHLIRLSNFDAQRSGSERISRDEEIENLGRELRRIDDQLNALPPGSPARKPLSQKKLHLSNRQSFLRKERIGDKVKPDWMAVYAMYRELVRADVGGAKEREIFEKAKDAWCEANGADRGNCLF